MPAYLLQRQITIQIRASAPLARFLLMRTCQRGFSDGPRSEGRQIEPTLASSIRRDVSPRHS